VRFALKDTVVLDPAAKPPSPTVRPIRNSRVLVNRQFTCTESVALLCGQLIMM
jgi:hypothetical protein